MTTEQFYHWFHTESLPKLGLIRCNWPLIGIFTWSKSWVLVEFWLLEPKLLNLWTQTWWQNDRETKLGKVRHWNPKQITYKQVKIMFQRSRGYLSPPPHPFPPVFYSLKCSNHCCSVGEEDTEIINRENHRKLRFLHELHEINTSMSVPVFLSITFTTPGTAMARSWAQHTENMNWASS